MKKLTSRWGATVDPLSVKPEYPRPNLVRERWMNLNGLWDCAINTEEACEAYDRRILVPLAPEAPLSGVGVVVQPNDFLHYRRFFTLPEGFDQGRVLLHFGAVDQECVVWVNGVEVGRHEGGYLPFAFDITKALRPGENELTLRVRDFTENKDYARGKQKLVRQGKYASIFYTPVSGIWKTVWLESVPQEYIQGVRITPMYDAGQVEITVHANCSREAQIEVSLKGNVLWRGESETERPLRIPLKPFSPWSPETPTLYDVEIRLGEDRVRSYFGMRKFEARRDKHGVNRFWLNDKPFFFNGLLDQAYWPEGLLTAPCDDALEYDITQMKELGYNTLRMHVKIEEERFYYLCDRLGMVVWQDMPNGGGEYDMEFVTDLPNAYDWFGREIRDDHYDAFARGNEEGRRQYYRELEGMIRLLYNYPCIALWTPFNEGWGQFDAPKATEKIRAIDGTRLINEACGWFDQGGGDLYSSHSYVHKYVACAQPDRVTALTEYGGYAWPVEGHTACEKEFGYQAYRSREELTRNYERLWNEEILPNVAKGLSAAIYTQETDVEEEINGIMTYDRAVIKPEVSAVKALNRKLYEIFEKETE